MNTRRLPLASHCRSAIKLIGLLASMTLLGACGSAPAAPAQSPQTSVSQAPASQAPASQAPASQAASTKPTSAAPSASVSSAPAAASASKPAAVGTFRSAFTSPTAAFAPMWIGIDSGAFEQQGVKLEMITAATNVASAALVSDQLDGLFNSSPAMVSADAAGLDLIMIGSMINKSLWTVWAQPSVTSPEQLKGKPFGCGKPGTPIEYGCLTSLKQMGLAVSDVQTLRLDDVTQLYTALVGKQLEATVLQPPETFAAQHNGYRQLAGMSDIPFQGVGLTIKRSRIPQLRPVLLPLLRGLQIGMRRFNTDHDFSIQVLKKYTKNDDPQFLQETYDFYKQVGFTEDLKIVPRGIQEVVDFVAATNDKASKLKVSDLYDNSFAEQVK